jgi:hypothetical protein
MNSPEQDEINALKAEIAEYAALSLAERLIPTTAALITAKQNTLTELLKAQATATTNPSAAVTRGEHTSCHHFLSLLSVLNIVCFRPRIFLE